MTEENKLAETLAAKEGLVDVRFALSNADEASLEQVCGEVNALYAAVERGEFKPLYFADSRRQ